MSEMDKGQEAVNQVLMAAINEQKNARRWKIFFRILYLVIFLVVIIAARNTKPVGLPTEDHVALIKLHGMVGGQITTDKTLTPIKNAMKNPAAKTIILDIDSSGGYPTQSHIIKEEILRLKAMYPEKKVYAVAGDVMGSAAYHIALAADEIYASPTSIVGSIGVLMPSYGFTGLLEKIGVEDRTLQVGKYKSLYSPTKPINEEEKTLLQLQIKQAYKVFVNDVLASRGDKLKGDKELLFSGAYWIGQNAVDNGIVDGIGNIYQVSLSKADTDEMIVYLPKRSFVETFNENLNANIKSTITSMMYFGK